ncbi:spermidine/putrescine transport system substrate-binding protein [Tistlia consotensis]|uniref:Spermidine/putrescine transport system substrate-binding protein n=1 Tax=Tistlia consotensis USBA 355 TaxID=560819 RepID=A0A1Y6B943_9PROT|nr:spermidine/putrescine ABC transporter substrate-binding protein [Tistlia consotensis]SME99392.1 spermidine/putrescine transport system substrate-binding protein [Tistlia consotensis USBA 355]SNR76964.1 spermidine/putrescine transport system substrate-binding protein [Tistlia consotensis]
MSKRSNSGRTIDPALLRGLTEARVSRRGLLQAGALGLGMAALGPLAARTARAAERDWEAWWKQQKPTDELVFANWPYYIDVADKGAKNPSLDDFTKASGIKVKYLEVIQGNAPFYAKIAPVLKAGQSIGYDLMVMTNTWQLTELVMQDWLVPLWKEKLPNFKKYASPSVVSPDYDKGNRYTLAWQSGFTGIAYNPKLTKREITSIDDLWDPAFAGHVGMMSDITELGSVALLKLGIDPAKSTKADWEKAAKVLKEQKDKGLVRQYYDQSYITALEHGDTWISQAWSGDVFQANAKGFKDLKFVAPKEGVMLWHDNMMIPVGAKNPLSALAWMNFYYTPKTAALIEDYVNYVCPVPDAKDVILKDLQDPDVANSVLVFPTEAMYAKAHDFYTFKSYAEYQSWNSVFTPIIQG